MTATTSKDSTIAEATSFLSSLFHDDRNSLYAHATRTDRSGWKQTNIKSKDFINAFEAGSFNRYADQYVSTSGFISAKRRVSDLRQVNGRVRGRADGLHPLLEQRPVPGRPKRNDPGTIPGSFHGSHLRTLFNRPTFEV